MIDLERFKTRRNMAVPIQKHLMSKIGNTVATSCANLIKIGPVMPEIANVTIAPYWTRRQKSAYPTEYLGKYKTNLHQLFSVGRHM